MKVSDAHLTIACTKTFLNLSAGSYGSGSSGGGGSGSSSTFGGAVKTPINFVNIDFSSATLSCKSKEETMIKFTKDRIGESSYFIG